MFWKFIWGSCQWSETEVKLFIIYLHECVNFINLLSIIFINLFVCLSLSFLSRYKSNEDYVYVRGRGRGKYVCGECGIRCKKPSMLKKHIRTHTDVRPYVCKHCNFAFKTKGRHVFLSNSYFPISVCLIIKWCYFCILCQYWEYLFLKGNLTKHMKSKAHGKKCLEMGVSESSVDELETEEAGSCQKELLWFDRQWLCERQCVTAVWSFKPSSMFLSKDSLHYICEKLL